MTLKEPHANGADLHLDSSGEVNTEELLGQVAVEFFEQCAAGNGSDIEDYAKKYPEIAEHIRRTFPALKFVGDSTASSDAVDLGAPVERTNEQLGDFRIFAELGRGGMGVVYEAEQLSIGRRVALKILPFATLADSRALARFKNEVRAAATLDHPNIVTVHSVGEARGIHYFAMQLIRGQSLAEVILELRKIRGESPHHAVGMTEDAKPADSNSSHAAMRETRGFAELSTVVPTEVGDPFYRRVAELGEQAANALHFAHEQGVVHRDVKPANLMLDTAGKVYVTDFGLARIESDASLTMTGDLIGTLRYMAPEQALGKRVSIDHRTDVYALGATLYELATLRPILDGTDRAELLRQVATQQPIAPGRIADDFPRDLETIICKALSKDPEDRYDTADDMARDLRRWLDDKPIFGKRPNPLQLGQRWIRRNPLLVIGSLLTLVLLAGVLLFGVANANARTELQRKLRYPPTVNGGFEELADGRFPEAGHVLATTTPAPNQEDLRSFEWYLLQKLLNELRSDERVTLNGRIRELHRSPSGRWLAILTVTGQLSVVDLQTDYRQTNLKVEPLAISGPFVVGATLIAFSPDDRFLYSAAHGKATGENSPLLRFDLNSDKPVGTDVSSGTAQPDCHSVAVSPDGRIATLGWAVDLEETNDGKLRRKQTCVIRDPIDGRLQAQSDFSGKSLAFAPDGKSIAIAGSNYWIHVLEAERLEAKHQLPNLGADKGSRLVSFSRDSRLLAVNSQKGVKVWDVTGDEAEEMFEIPVDWPWDIKFLDDNLVATTSENGWVEVRSVDGQFKVDQFKLNVLVRGLEFLPETDTLVIGGTSNLLFRPLRRPPVGPVHDASMHVVGVIEGMAAIVTREADLWVWQRGKGLQHIANIVRDLPASQGRMQTLGGVSDMSISADGQTISVTGPSTSIWHRDGRFLGEVEEQGQTKLTPDGAHIVTAVGPGVLALKDWRTGKQVVVSQQVEVPDPWMIAMEFSRSGAWLATGYGSPQTPGAVCVWKIEDNTIQFIAKFDHSDGVEDISFTADEQWVIGGDATGVRLHHIKSRTTRTLNTGGVRGVDVTKDGKRIVTAGGSMIRFWDVETGERMGSFDAGTGTVVTAVRFLDDARLLYIVRDVGVRILDAAPR
ncbi:MAG: protein kinase [Planctomycetales bacterium]|nr:protein kinase [Planctomycetales bacterium]